MTADEMLALTDAMKSRGVRSFDVAGHLRVDFAPPDVPLKDDKAVQGADNCPCGHAIHAHINGLCVHGCEVEKCVGTEGGP